MDDSSENQPRRNDQKLMRKPNRTTRSSMPSLPTPVTLVMVEKPPRFWIVPSGLNCRFETLPLGKPKCGVLVKFRASARNSIFHRSVTLNARNSPKSRLVADGPRSVLYPTVPKDAVVTGAKASGSKYGDAEPMPPRISTLGLT